MINSYQSDRAIVCNFQSTNLTNLWNLCNHIFSTADYLLASNFVFLFKSIVLIDYLHASNETINTFFSLSFSTMLRNIPSWAVKLLSSDHIANGFVPGLNMHNASTQHRLTWDLVRFSTMLTDTCGSHQQQHDLTSVGSFFQYFLLSPPPSGEEGFHCASVDFDWWC